jgi:Flp pilus assembly protein TadD
MAFAIRKIPLTVVLMLGCSAMTLPARAGWFDSDPKPAESKSSAKPVEKAAEPATTLEDSIRQAQLLRLAGQYPEAIKHLSQLMMVASDDGRVISEYGKTLAAMGRPADAVNFLTRAQQLQPSDWTIYSALGVAYDQIGDQKSAQQSYQQALAVKPEEPSVLNNYALSRMLAKDPDMARKLAARAENAGGNSDAKIARNIALIRSLAADMPAAIAVATQTSPAQTSVARNQAQTPVVASNTAPHAQATGAGSAPQVAHNVLPAPEAHDSRVVMQRVPVDPLAGPVQPAKPANAANVATNAPRPLQPSLQSKTVATEPAKVDMTAKQLPAKPMIATIVKADVDPAAKTVVNKPATTALSTVPVVKAADAGKPVPVTAAKAPAPVSLAETKPVPAKTAEAVKPAATPSTAPVVKAADAGKPVPAPTAKLPASAPVTVVATKPAPAKTAEAAKPVVSASSATPVVKAAEATKPVPVTPSKAPTAAPVTLATTKPVPAKMAEADKPAAAVTLKLTPPPVKAADAGKPVPAPKVLPPVPVKAATKDAIPGLRMSANAY